MKRLNQDMLLKALDDWWKDEWNLKNGMIRALFFKGKKGKAREITEEITLRGQAYKQLRELVQCEDMVEQYRDEMEAEQAEIELTYLDIVLDLYEQLGDKSRASK
jgi:gluconate kinase